MSLPASFWQRLTRWADQARMAIVEHSGQRIPYAGLLESVDACRAHLSRLPALRGRIVSLETDFSTEAIAWLLALLEEGAIVAPLAPQSLHQHEQYFSQVPPDCCIELGPSNELQIQMSPTAAFRHPLLDELRNSGHGGMILYSSGSSGRPKAVLHDGHRFVASLLASVSDQPLPQSALAFLLWDHIGGQNTLFYNLCAGNTLCLISDRSPARVLQTIANDRIETLVTTPSFLNWVLASEVAIRYDLSHLKVVRYGTEVVMESTLTRLRALWPQVRFIQTYGLSETGILPTRSRDDASAWIRLGNEATHPVRVRDGMLEVRTPTAMLGYLNQPTPWTQDGWFPTGDRVETDGEWIRILGRASDLINIGGRKVYPAEVEQVIAQRPEVLDVLVRGERHPLLGQLVVADVRLRPDTSRDSFERELRQSCAKQLAEYKIPQKFNWVESVRRNTCGKKVRQSGS